MGEVSSGMYYLVKADKVDKQCGKLDSHMYFSLLRSGVDFQSFLKQRHVTLTQPIEELRVAFIL